MLPLLFTIVSCVLFGSSAGIDSEEVCYGSTFRLPFEYTPPVFRGRLYFTPSNGGSRRVVMDNGEAKAPRIKVSYGSVQFTDLHKKDDGTFSVSFDGNRLIDVITLKILDCAEDDIENYGDFYNCAVPRQTEYVEFTPLHNLDETKILWNRTDPQTNKRGRGQVRYNTLELESVTQADSGYYNFRRKDNTLLSRKRLTVQENKSYNEAKVNEQLVIRNRFSGALWSVTFTPKGETEPITLINAGMLVEDEDWSLSLPFSGRISVVHSNIEINPVESSDSGLFEFRDSQGNLVHTAEVKVQYASAPTFVYIAIVVGIIFGGIVCCCCVRKCCCKKSSSKRDEPAPQAAAAPVVHYHDKSQPTHPSYSHARAPDYTHQPMNPLVYREPATTSLGPPVAAPGGLRAAPALSLNSDCLSSDPEPKFELKGLTFPSAPPLSSDFAVCHVYTSDKLNFP
ncbi:uncharacterized protein LOC143325444 [Chaetodon auriga]|uniref:uncharacterized protein LOC143325444 n=1 Tax=Chaetodon auriga TaxID=39042 RepID=UPI0040330248